MCIDGEVNVLIKCLSRNDLLDTVQYNNLILSIDCKFPHDSLKFHLLECRMGLQWSEEEVLWNSCLF